MKLCKSYRSTSEITDFAQNILSNNELETVSRHGEKPQILKMKNSEAEISAIADLIRDFKKSAYQSLGVICKTQLLAKDISDRLKLYTEDVHFLSNQSSTFIQGVVITSAHMAKGLEFDEVIVPQANDDNYSSEIDRSMLYVAVTRAMHKLVLTYDGKISSLIKF